MPRKKTEKMEEVTKTEDFAKNISETLSALNNTFGKAENQAEVKQEQGYKAWEEKTNGERQASINEYSKSIIAKTIKENKAFWKKDMSVEEIDKTLPFNPSTGRPYGGLTSVLLRSVTALEGYESPEFLTMKQANLLGGKLQKAYDKETGEVIVNEKTGKEQYVKGVKIAIVKRHEYVPKLDTEGKPITREYTTRDGEVKQEPVFEKVALKEPMLETTTLYHISQFNDLNQDRLQEIDLSSVYSYRKDLSTRDYDPRPNLKDLNLGASTTLDLENFLSAQMKGKDYVKVNTRINENAKEVSLEQQKTNEKNSGLGR